MSIFAENKKSTKIIEEVFLERRKWLQDAECLLSFSIEIRHIMIAGYVTSGCFSSSGYDGYIYRFPFLPCKGSLYLYRKGDEFAVYANDKPISLDILLTMISFPYSVCYQKNILFKVTRFAEIMMVYQSLCKIRNPQLYQPIKKPFYKRNFLFSIKNILKFKNKCFKKYLIIC